MKRSQQAELIEVLRLSACLFYYLAEFIIMLGETSETLGKFKTALKQNGAEFPVSGCFLYYGVFNIIPCTVYFPCTCARKL